MLVALMLSVSLTSCGDDDEPEENTEQGGEYAGKNFVGTWEGSDGSDSFALVLGEDGSYTDYLVINGKRLYPVSGKYSVSGNKITVPSNSNLYDAWGEIAYTMTVSGSKMTLSCSLMENWGQKLVLTKQ